MRVLALGGSIRANLRSTDVLVRLVRESATFDDYVGRIAVFAPKTAKQRIILTNTELCAGAALFAAKEMGAEIQFFPLASLFPRRELPLADWDGEEVGLPEDIAHYDFLDIDGESKAKLISEVRAADAIILCSPVY